MNGFILLAALALPSTSNARKPFAGNDYSGTSDCTGIATVSKNKQGKLIFHKSCNEPEFKGATTARAIAYVGNLQHQFINRRSAT